MNLARSFVNYADRVTTWTPTRPDLRLALLTLIFEERGESAMGKQQRLPCSLARHLSSQWKGEGSNWRYRHPCPPVDTTQATEFLSRVHPPPRRCAAKRRPCRRENIIQAIVPLSLFVFLLPRFFISCFFRGHLSAALGLQQPTQTTGIINQFIHPSSLSPFSQSLLPGFSAPPLIASAAQIK